MAVEFYIDNWLTAAGAVGLLKIAKSSNKANSIKIDGRKVEVDDNFWKNLPEYYANQLLEVGFDVVKKHLEDYVNAMKKGKNTQLKNPYNQIVLTQLSPFYTGNSIFTNQSYKYIKEVESRAKIYLGPYLHKKDLQNLLENPSEWQSYEDNLKKWIKEAILEAFKKLENYTEPQDAPTCFFCKERKAYLKDKKYNTFDAVNFSPLSASPDYVENFFYNGKNTMYLCKECEKLIYCAAFGFTKTDGLKRYLFVYLPENLEVCESINDIVMKKRSITKDILKAGIVAVSKSLESQKARWALENIYVVEILPVGDAKSNIYSFSIPPRLAKVIRKRIDNYPNGFNRIFDIFLDYIYRGRSLYDLLSYIMLGFLKSENFKELEPKTKEGRLIKLGMSLKESGTNRGFLFFIKFQEDLNMEQVKENGNLNTAQNKEKQINWAYSEGKRLREHLIESDGDKADKKIEVLSYRLLDSIRRRDIDSFFQNLMRVYLNVRKPVPSVFINTLKDISFEHIGYAFLIGINTNTTQDNNEENDKSSVEDRGGDE